MRVTPTSLTPIDFDGLRILDYTAGLDVSSSLAVIDVPPGVRHKPSWSKRSDKYYYVVQGSVVFTVDGEPDTLSPGDVCIVPRGARFLYANEGPGDARLVLVHTPGFKLECEVFEE